MNGKTIILGGSGFFGPVILEKFPDIVSVGRTAPPSYIKNLHIQVDSLDQLNKIDSLDFDNVIFLIGSSNHHLINIHPTLGIDCNVTPLSQALSYFKKRNIRKFVCFTTILLYDLEKISLPVSENQPLNPYINEYVFSKYLSEEIVKYYKDSVPSIIIRCSNIYGPTKLVRPDLIPTLIQNIFASDDISVWNKKPLRDFIYLEDAAEAIIKLIDSNFTGHVNLGTGVSSSIGEVAKILEDLSGKKITDQRKDVSGPMHFKCDISLLQSLTDWKPKHTIEEGIRLTYERMGKWGN